MKKIILTILIIFICGCTNKEIKINTSIYYSYINELKSVNESSELPFDVDVIYDKLDSNTVMYQVIIDNTKIDLYDIEAIAVHNKETEDIFPSIGIFDEKENIEVGKKPSGIILVGYINYDGEIEDFECEIKLLVKYKFDNNSYKVYFVTKK